MSRTLLSLLVVCLVSPISVGADARSAFGEAHRELKKADFEELSVAKRDELFATIAAWDHPDAVRNVAEILALYATYLDVIDYRLDADQTKLREFMSRSALSDQAIAVRQIYINKVKRGEKAYRDAYNSLDLLVENMGKWKEDKTLSMAVAYLPAQPTWRVRSVAALGAAYWHKSAQSDNLSKKLFKSLQQLSKDKEPGVRQSVAKSLASFRRIEAVPVLKRCVNDPDWRVRAAAIASIRKSPSDEGVGFLITRMKKEKGRLEDDIVQTLTAITGQKLKWPEQWEGWWNGVGKHIPPKGATTAQVTEIKKRKEKSNQFYGINTRSQRICFIIDMSGSMKHKTEELKQKGPITGKKNTDTAVAGKTRWEVARNELKRAVQNLNSKAYFSIILFNHSVQPWRSEMVNATPANKKAASEFLDKVGPRGATYTLGALREGFSLGDVKDAKEKKKQKDGPRVDTIFLLSDGGPTGSQMDGPSKPMEPDPILDQVKHWNEGLGVVIHCIAVHTDEVGTYFLKSLASQNGGQFVARK